MVAAYNDHLAVAGGLRAAEAVVLALDDERRHVGAVELVLDVTSRCGATSGKARQSTPAEPVAAAVRQATRAPDERPPVTSANPASASPRSCSTTAVHAASRWWAGAGDRRPATR